LSNVRDSLWKVSNIVSAASVDDDRAAEEVRKALETCDLEEAIAKFIANNCTGENRCVICFVMKPYVYIQMYVYVHM
jgi:hypothetical protein